MCRFRRAVSVVPPCRRFSRSEYLGGPRSLLPAALEALAKWSARPVRVNGVPIVNPMILQIPLK